MRSKYSMCNAEVPSTELLFLNPSFAAPSGGRSVANRRSKPNKSRSVLLYSYAVSRRSTLRPPVDRRASSTFRNSAVNNATAACRSWGVGWGFASSGGISLTLIRSSTSCHMSASLPFNRSASSVSSRSLAFCLSGP